MSRWRAIARRSLTTAAVGWPAAIPAATYAASQPLGAPAYALTLLVFAVGGAVCHQIDTRSFHLWGRQMPVCARCTGIYVGAGVAAVAVLMSRRAPVARPRVVLAVASIPAVASLAFEWTTGIDPGNIPRAITGVLLGAAVAVVVIAGGVPSPE